MAMDCIEELTETFKKNGATVQYVLNECGKMTNIIFTYGAYTSYVDVIEKGNQYKILCYGDYSTYVLGKNWWHVYLDDIGTREFNADYIAEKVEAGEVYEFDPGKFIKDVKEYFKENNINRKSVGDAWDDEDVEASLEEVDGTTSAIEFVNMISDIIDPSVWELAQSWGWKLRDHFLCWIAIIRYAQNKLKEDKAK